MDRCAEALNGRELDAPAVSKRRLGVVQSVELSDNLGRRDIGVLVVTADAVGRLNSVEGPACDDEVET